MSAMTTLESLSKIELTLRPGQKARNTTYYPGATPDGGDVRFLLGPLGSFPASIPFEPPALGGNGGEPRKAIRFAIRDERIVNDIQSLGQKAQHLLGNPHKLVWNTAIVEASELSQQW